MRSNSKYPNISTKSLLERRRKQQTAMKMNPDVALLTLISKDDPFSEWGSLQAVSKITGRSSDCLARGIRGGMLERSGEKLGRPTTTEDCDFKLTCIRQMSKARKVVGGSRICPQ